MKAPPYSIDSPGTTFCTTISGRSSLPTRGRSSLDHWKRKTFAIVSPNDDVSSPTREFVVFRNASCCDRPPAGELPSFRLS
jgi:hypothetical protein